MTRHEPPINDPEKLMMLKAELFTAAWALIDLDNSPPAVIEQTFTLLRRQPASTIQADLAHARAEIAKRKAFLFLTQTHGI